MMPRALPLVPLLAFAAASAPQPPQNNQTHYGDPCGAIGCLSDEQGAALSGVDGSFCSPKCQGVLDKCPQDKPPTAAGATPKCALKTTTGLFCGLVCSRSAVIKDQQAADAACGDGASCKPVQGLRVPGVGLDP